MEKSKNTLPIGTVLSSRYKILRVIGHGGFGTVYMARQLNMNRDVAVKVLPSEFLSVENVVERFRREAKLASRLSHPNTITLFDYGRDGDSLFIVMELLKGKDLADLLDKEKSIEPKRVVHIVSQVLRSLREAHAYGIVHRDLKPENIFVSSLSGDEDVVKVLDFGIAQFASSDLETNESVSRPGTSSRKLTRTGSTIGTPAYMSPEQAAGEVLTNRSDLYSLGIIMYELVSGRLPFPNDDMVKTMRAHLFEDVPPLDIPAIQDTPLEYAIMRALEKDPEDRFQDAEEMLRALQGGEEQGQPLVSIMTGRHSRDYVTDIQHKMAVLTRTGKHALAYTDTLDIPKPTRVIGIQKITTFNDCPFTTMKPITENEYPKPTFYWDWTGFATADIALPERHRPRNEDNTIGVTISVATIFLLLAAVIFMIISW